MYRLIADGKAVIGGLSCPIGITTEKDTIEDLVKLAAAHMHGSLLLAKLQRVKVSKRLLTLKLEVYQWES